MLSGCRLITQYKNDLMKNIKNKTSAVDKGKAKQKGLDVREPQLAQQLATQPTRPNKKRTGIRGSQQEEQFVTKDEFTELKLLIERQNTLIVKLGSEMREATAEQNTIIAKQGSETREAIAKQNTTIAEQNTIIAKQGSEMREAIAEQNTTIAKQGSEMREAIAEQNTTIAKQNTIIAEQGGEMKEAIIKQGGETKEAIAKVEGNIKELSMAMKILLWGIPLILGLATSIIAFVLVN